MKIIPYAVLLGFGTIGAGGWYKFHTLQPSNLKQYLEWQGFRLISDTESNYWKAVLEENKDLLNSLNITGIEGVKGWCKSNMDSENYEPIKNRASLLCVDNPKTVKARIIQLDGSIDKLMSSNEQYKVAYVFRKHISGFNSLIGYSPTVNGEGKEKINFEEATQIFKKWCDSSLGKEINETLVLNVREFCIPKNFSKIKDYLKGKTLLTDSGQEQELEKVYQKIKDFKSYTSEIFEDGKDKLKDWCNTNLERDFSESLNVFDEILPKVISRCVKGVDLII
nr:hypothetical protein [Mycoplasma haemocanis]